MRVSSKEAGWPRLAELVKRDHARAIRVNLREELRDARLLRARLSRAVAQQTGGAEGLELAQFDGPGVVEVDALEDAQERFWRERHRAPLYQREEAARVEGTVVIVSPFRLHVRKGGLTRGCRAEVLSFTFLFQ